MLDFIVQYIMYGTDFVIRGAFGCGGPFGTRKNSTRQEKEN